MIVDDQMAICGSAHINDRSLLGQRDSEVCVVINDLEEENGVFGGQVVRVGKCCSSWRKKIFSYVSFSLEDVNHCSSSFRIMLGIALENPHHIDTTDPVSDDFYSYFRLVAKTNTLIYEEVFGTLPSNHARNFDQVNEYTTTEKLRYTDPARVKYSELHLFHRSVSIFSCRRKRK